MLQKGAHVLLKADQDLVRRSVLPGLASLLDPEQFLQAVRTSMPHLEPQSIIRLSHIIYNKMDRCQVLYEVETSDGPKRLWGKAFRFEEFYQFSKTSRNGNPANRGVLSNCAVILGLFPDDLELDLLPLFPRHHEKRRDFFSTLLPSHPLLWEADLEIIRYIPQQRLVAQLGKPPHAAFIKTYAAKQFQRLQHNIKNIISRGPLRVPRCLGASKHGSVLAFEWIPGNTIGKVQAYPDFDKKVFNDAGMALATFHEQDFTRFKSTRRWTAEKVHENTEQLSHLVPSLTRRANDMALRLSRLMRSPLNRMCNVHGDFNPSNLLLSNGAVVVIDFDATTLGNPAIDLGNFIGYLDRRSVMGEISPSQAEAATGALVDGYEYVARGSLPVCAATYAAVSLCQSTLQPFRKRLPDWPLVAEILLARAETFLKQAETEASTTRRKFIVSDVGSKQKVIRHTTK